MSKKHLFTLLCIIFLSTAIINVLGCSKEEELRQVTEKVPSTEGEIETETVESIKEELQEVKEMTPLIEAKGESTTQAESETTGGYPTAGKAIYDSNCAVGHGGDGNSPLVAAGMAVPNFA